MATRTGWGFVVVLVAAVVVGLAAASPVAAAGGTPLKVGYLLVMDDAPAILAYDGGFYEQHGLDVELVLFSSGTDLIKAIVGGQLDAGVLGFTNAVNWVARGADLKVIGGAQMGYHSIVVPKGSDIRTVEDLRGRRLASQQRGSTADVVLNGVTLADAGLSRPDLEWAYVSPSVAVQSLAAGRVDAAFLFEPYEQLARAQMDVDVIYEIGQVWPFPCMVVISSGKAFDEKQDAIFRLLEAQKDAIDLLQNDSAAAAKAMAPRFIPEGFVEGPEGRVSAEVIIQRAIETQTFNWAITQHDIDRMKEIIDIMLEQEVLERHVDVDEFLDLTWQQSKEPN